MHTFSKVICSLWNAHVQTAFEMGTRKCNGKPVTVPSSNLNLQSAKCLYVICNNVNVHANRHFQTKLLTIIRVH